VGEALGQTIARVYVQQELDAFPVLDLCAVDPDSEHQSLGVHQQMSLASFDLLAAIVAALFAAYARGFDRLAIHYGRGGLRVPLEADTHALTQGGMHPLPGAVQAPEAEVVVDGLPGWEVVWQKPPGAAAPYDVEDGVEDLTRRIETRAPTGFGSRKVGLQAAPFGI
jgi:hypothetical protein